MTKVENNVGISLKFKDLKTGRYISSTEAQKRTGKSIGELLGNLGKTTNETVQETTKRGFLSKLGNLFKGKGAKIALAIGLISLLGAGGVYLYNKLSNNNKTVVPKPTEPPKPKKLAEPDKPAEPAKPYKPMKPTEPQKPDKPEVKPGVIEAGQDKYKVVKGDNVWNIAKKDLIANHKEKDYKPTNAEILKRTKELIELNNLKFEKDNYRVIIKPDQELKLK